MSATQPRFRSAMAFALAALALLVLVAGASVLWRNASSSVSTDDAQVDGHVHPVNARVGGTVIWVNPEIDDTKFVAAGTVLARLDANDYTPAVDRLQGDVQSEQAQLQSAQLAVPIVQATSASKLPSSKAGVAEAESDLSSARAGEEAAAALVTQAEANSRRAEGDRARYERLVSTQEISRFEYDTRMAEASVASAQLTSAQANLLAAQQKIQAARQRIAERGEDVNAAATAPGLVATAKASVARVAGDLQKSKAALHDAELSLSYTQIVAPVSGIVGRRGLELGQRIGPGQLLLNIVPTDHLWVTANFKETQLKHIVPGERATIHVDTYGADIQGTVESIGGATGSKYALIAPDNATGNYVKVVQRIPVRIRLNTAQVAGHPLLPGMSVETTVN